MYLKYIEFVENVWAELNRVTICASCMTSQTLSARRIAQDDVNAFLTGTRPTPALRGPLRPWQIRIARSNESFNEFN